MLRQSEIDKLKGFGFDTEKLIEAVKAEKETEVVLPKLFTEEERTTYGKNVGADKFKEGEKAGKEIFVKDAKKAFGVEFEGKNMDTLVTSVTAKLGKGDEEIKTSLANLQTKYTEDMAKKDQLISQKETEIFQTKTFGSVKSYFEKETTIGKDDLAVLFKNKFQIEKTDNGIVVKEDGVILKNDVESPLTPKEVAQKFYEPYIKKEGRGGDNEPGGGAGGKFKDFETMSAHYTAKGENPAEHLTEVEGFEEKSNE